MQRRRQSFHYDQHYEPLRSQKQRPNIVGILAAFAFVIVGIARLIQLIHGACKRRNTRA